MKSPVGIFYMDIDGVVVVGVGISRYIRIQRCSYHLLTEEPGSSISMMRSPFPETRCSLEVFQILKHSTRPDVKVLSPSEYFTFTDTEIS